MCWRWSSPGRPGARRRACAPCQAAVPPASASLTASRLIGTAAGSDRLWIEFPLEEGGLYSGMLSGCMVSIIAMVCEARPQHGGVDTGAALQVPLGYFQRRQQAAGTGQPR